MIKKIGLLCLLLFFLNCEDKKSQPTNRDVTSNIDSVAIETDSVEAKIPETADSLKKPEYPFLTDENAMEFFLNYDKKNKENKVRITTDFGDIEIELFDQTKFHRANFIYLTKRGYFDETQFYRVVNNFVIQGGNTDDPDVKHKRSEIGHYLLPKDTRHGFKHNRGVISMPSSEIENPYKLASPFEFFIVQNPNGAHHLDDNYTVFGRVTKGMEVVDEIAKQKTDKRDWPLHNIYIRKVEIID